MSRDTPIPYLLDDRFRAAGKPPVALNPAGENLANEDILELPEAGAIPLALAFRRRSRA